MSGRLRTLALPVLCLGVAVNFCVFADRDFLLASALGDYATALIVRGEIARATPFLSESLEIYQKQGNQYEVGQLPWHVGQPGPAARRYCPGPQTLARSSVNCDGLQTPGDARGLAAAVRSGHPVWR